MQSRNQYIFLSIKILRSSYYLYDSVLVAPCFKYTIAHELKKIGYVIISM